MSEPILLDAWRAAFWVLEFRVLRRDSEGILSKKSSSGLTASARKAFSSWWAVLGIVATSVSGFNLARNVFRFTLSDIVAEVFRFYHTLVHVPFLWLFQRMHWPAPMAWMIDASVLWLLVGGIVLRSYLAILGSTSQPMEKRMLSDLLFDATFPPTFWVAVLPLLWPAVLTGLLRTAIYAAPEGEEGLGKVMFVPREILAWQALASFICIGLWFALNAMLELYG